MTSTSSEPSDRKMLPVYRLAVAPESSLERLHGLATRFLGIENYSLHEIIAAACLGPQLN
jgi:hypothetical protein